MEDERNDLWDRIIDAGIATDEELQLAAKLKGFTMETLREVIYIRTGNYDLEEE